MEKYIYDFFYKTRGVISVFLVIVLVPMVTACCLFVDASRIKLARSVIQSSGDLALNTVMSQFDGDLAEIYGLMASCQDTEDIVAAAENYFKDCMVSQGVDSITASETSEIIAGLLEEDGNIDTVINDLLGITVEDRETSISAVTNGNLANAAILESQIVEFMKYRAPIDAVEELFNSLKSEAADKTEYIEEEADLVNDMQAYYEAEGDVIECLKNAYDQIIKLNNLNLTKERIEGIKEQLNSLSAKYVDNNVYSSNSATMYSGYHYSLVHQLFTFTSYNSPSVIPYNNNNTINVGEYTGTITANPSVSRYSKTLKDAYTNYSKHVEYANKLKKANGQYPYENNNTHNPQYWMLHQKNNIVSIMDNYRKYTHKEDTHSVYRSYDILKAQQSFLNDNRDEEITINGEKTTLGDATDKILADIEKLGRENEEATKIYNSLRQRLYNVSNTYYAPINSKKSNMDAELSKAAQSLKDFVNNVQEANALINGTNDQPGIKGYLSSALSQIQTWEQEYADWGKDFTENSDFAKNSDLAKDNKETYDNLGQNSKEKNELDPKEADELKEMINDMNGRLDRVWNLLNTVASAINDTKYGNASVKDIDSVNAMKNAASAQLSISKMSPRQSEMNSLAQSTLSALFVKSDKIDGIKVITSGSQINSLPLTKSNSELFKEMERRFGKTAQDEQKTAETKGSEDKYKDIKSQKDKTASDLGDEKSYQDDSIKPIVNNSDECGELPSGNPESPDTGGFTADISALASHVSGLFTDFSKEVGDIRDILYIWYYILNMFSYDTYEKEISYNKEHGEEEKEKKSLTNIPIDAKHNLSYRCEIEYLLYGSDSVAKNKLASYGTIFAMRFVLNMAYAFMNFWNDLTVTELAAGVSAATFGVIPEPLVKVIIILALTVAESAWDIGELRQGKPVAFIKSKETWKCSFNGSSVNSADSSDGDKGGWQYSDYLKLFLIMNLLTTKKDRILLRTADLIQSNMRMKNNAFLLKKSTVYYQLKFECKTSILMLALPIVENTTEGAVDLSVSSWNTVSGVMYRGY